MKFQLAFLLISSLLASPLDLNAKVADSKDGQLLGLVTPKTREQLDKTTDGLNDVVKGLLGLELNKLQLLGNKNNENAVLAGLKPNSVSNANNAGTKNSKSTKSFQEQKKENGLIDDLLDVVTIPKH